MHPVILVHAYLKGIMIDARFTILSTSTKHCKIPTLMQTAVRRTSRTSRTIGRNVCNALADHDPVLIDINDDLLSTRSCSVLRSWDHNSWIYTEPSPRVCTKWYNVFRTTISYIFWRNRTKMLSRADHTACRWPRYSDCIPDANRHTHLEATVDLQMLLMLPTPCHICVPEIVTAKNIHTDPLLNVQSVWGGLCMDMLRLAWRT